MHNIKKHVTKHVLKHVHLLHRHPHHYATALGMTLFMLAIGHVAKAEVSVLWVYAMLENLFGGSTEPSPMA